MLWHLRGGAGLLAMLVAAHACWADVNVKEEIKKLVPAATAMQKADFERLADAPTIPKPSDVEDKSLSLTLLTMKANEQRSAEQKKEFEYVGEIIIQPSRIGEEMYRTIGGGKFRVLLSPVTMIQANRIKEVTAEVTDNTAEGTISFEVPKLYRGKVGYVAQKSDGKWRITQFKMPAHGIHLVHGDRGIWSRRSKGQ